MVVLATCASVAQGDVITARADYWCPYNCQPNSAGKEGILIELLRDALSPLGHTIDYALLPWKQAVADVRTGQFNVVIGIAEDDSVGLLHTTEPQMFSITCAYGKNPVKKKITRAEDLRNLQSIGLAKDYSYGAKTDVVLRDPKMKKIVKPFGGDSPLRTNIRKVRDGSLQVLIEDASVMDFEIKDQGINDIVKWGCTEDRGPIWVGFSPKYPNSRKWVETLDKMQNQLRASGKIKEYYKRYGITEQTAKP